MTAVKNLNFFAQLFGMAGFDAMALLKRVGLAGREKERVANYSKGMKQRLMVARAHVNRPKILFLDEPTTGLDPTSSENIRNVILEERERRATIFLTMHDMREADKLSDRVAFIKQGKIVALHKPHSLKQAYGRRALEVEVLGDDGQLTKKEVFVDRAEPADSIQKIICDERVVTVHSKKATLEDIFIQMTGRELVR